MLQILINFLLLQPINILLCLIMITISIYLQRNAFYIHVIGVTILLLIVLYKINLCYGKIENKFKLYEYIVIIGGIIHTIVPIISIFYYIAMYVHVGICFMVHILHLSQCYLVFYDIKMKDTNYIIILWAVNIMEFFVNLAYCFPNVISNKLFVVPLVVVEISALLLSSLRLKSIHQSNYHSNNNDNNNNNNNNNNNRNNSSLVDQQQQRNNRNSTTSNNSSPNTSSTNYSGVSGISNEDKNNLDQSFSDLMFRKFQEIMTSRIMIVTLCCTISGLLIAFKVYNFQIFITGYTILLCINLLHLHHHTVTMYVQIVNYLGPVTFITLILINWLFFLLLSPSYNSLTALLLLLCSIPILTINLLKFYIIMGYHYTFYMTCFGMIVYLVTIILYGLNYTKNDNIYIFETFMVSSIIYSMAMILTDYKLIRGKRIYVNGITADSKHSSDNTNIGTSLNYNMKSHHNLDTGTGSKASTGY